MLIEASFLKELSRNVKVDPGHDLGVKDVCAKITYHFVVSTNNSNRCH